MRIIRYILNNEEIGDGYCDERCDHCDQRFQCYTTNQEVGGVIIVDNPTAKQLHGIQPYFLALKECRIMRCPHCLSLFKVTYDQLQNNTKFRCKVCSKYNWGSCEADEHDILIGMPNYEKDT